jgi:D-sedoheptulose 7-phosphate isomerase
LSMTSVEHIQRYFSQVAQIAGEIDADMVGRLVDELIALRARGGRLFLLGVGGSAANCSHAVNDFRKLAGIEAYAPTDNVSELTARTNDEGWETVFEAWLRTSRADADDAVFVMSVGGGNLTENVSPNLVRAIDEARRRHVRILGIVGRDGGYTKQVGDVIVIVPTVDQAFVTPHAEAFQAVVWHCLVSHPKLAAYVTKWEGIDAARGRA